MDRLETRELAYFLAVADELHFGRAAARLDIAQPGLSKTVRQLERRLGVTLFERTSRAVALTEAGRVLSREARVVLEAVAAAALRTQRAGTPDPRLILAMKPGGDAGLLPAILTAYEGEPEVLPVEVVLGVDPAGMLREGQADAALLYAPPDELGGLDTEPLLTEAPVAVLPRVLTRPLRDDLITVPMADLPPVVLLLAWPAHSTSLSVAALARAAAAAICSARPHRPPSWSARDHPDPRVVMVSDAHVSATGTRRHRHARTLRGRAVGPAPLLRRAVS
jgi:DNA-binding transcriptional LysR family regulator